MTNPLNATIHLTRAMADEAMKDFVKKHWDVEVLGVEFKLSDVGTHQFNTHKDVTGVEAKVVVKKRINSTDELRSQQFQR
jgi:hypothetical protein